MTTVQASACGKAILFGEHAVVYKQPAIAVPVTEVTATAIIGPLADDTPFTLVAPDLQQQVTLPDAPADDPLAVIVRKTLTQLQQSPPKATCLTLQSTIPLGRGLGSGAAISTAIVRALANFYNQPLSPAEVSALVYEVETLHHGTPSGIDNTVIAFDQPVYFIREQPIQRLRVATPFTLLIADTGRTAATREVVGYVRAQWQQTPELYEAYFAEIGVIAEQARHIIEHGYKDEAILGELMNQNQTLLSQMGVSSPQIDHLVQAARQAGVYGAKLSGAGWGGNVIALVESDDQATQVIDALQAAGAVAVIKTTVG